MPQFTIRPPLKTTVGQQRHSSESIGKPYPKEIREQVLHRDALGLPQSTNEIRQLQLARKYPSNRSINRWRQRSINLGHLRPYRRTGNKRATRELRTNDLFNLALYRSVKPKATLYEVKAFIYSANPNNLPYSNSQLYRAETRISLTRKAASTTAYQAYAPVNLAKRHNYWNLDYSFGIANIDPRDLIDIDEMGIEIEHSNRKHGKTAEGNRCNEAGVYNRNEKLNVLLAICGCDVNPLRWVETWTGEGTTLFRYYEFLVKVLDDLDVLFPGRVFCFTKDNLNSHKNPFILDTILARGHKIVFRAPYWAVDGAVEYVFNTTHSLIEVMFNNVDNLISLELVLREIIASMQIFRPYFEHVGFLY